MVSSRIQRYFLRVLTSLSKPREPDDTIGGYLDFFGLILPPRYNTVPSLSTRHLSDVFTTSVPSSSSFPPFTCFPPHTHRSLLFPPCINVPLSPISSLFYVYLSRRSPVTIHRLKIW